MAADSHSVPMAGLPDEVQAGRITCLKMFSLPVANASGPYDFLAQRLAAAATAAVYGHIGLNKRDVWWFDNFFIKAPAADAAV
eukprot:4978579-Alexandrium_andersonii.AAC.1